jgi:hypothetical protein
MESNSQDAHGEPGIQFVPAAAGSSVICHSGELKASQQNRRFAKNIATVWSPVPPWLAFSGTDFNALKRLWSFNRSPLSTRLLVSRLPEIRLQFVF